MNTISISAFDTLFVRDGKPFSMGDEAWADGIFPPPPSVFYGSLRTSYFSEHIEKLSLAGLPNDPTRHLKISKVLLAKEVRNELDYHFPCPLDIVVLEDKSADVLHLTSTATISNSTPSSMLSHKDLVEPAKGKWIDIQNLRLYLHRNSAPNNLVEQSELWEKEAKLGIAKDKKSGASADGKLYRVGMNRLRREARFVVEYDGLDIKKDGFIKLGGEGKAASFQHLNKSLNIKVPTFTQKKFKLYFATPCVLKNGWLPKTVDENTLIGTWQGHKVKVVAAGIDKPISLGGFDMRKGPKSMRRAIPAGSVYYLEYLGEDEINEVVKSFHETCLSEFDLAKEGFGLAYVGVL